MKKTMRISKIRKIYHQKNEKLNEKIQDWKDKRDIFANLTMKMSVRP